jgi:hypothetical protein
MHLLQELFTHGCALTDDLEGRQLTSLSDSSYLPNLRTLSVRADFRSLAALMDVIHFPYLASVSLKYLRGFSPDLADSDDALSIYRFRNFLERHFQPAKVIGASYAPA